MQRVIAFDLVRLFLAPLFLTPRGIDRVDLAMAHHIFPDEDSPHVGVLPTFWGMRVYRAREVVRLLAHVRAIWAESAPDDSDVALDARFRRIIDEIQAPGQADRQPIPPPRQLALRHKIARMIHELHATGMPLGRPVRSRVPRDAIYLNIGQLGLAIPRFFNWLDDRPDVTCAIMLHDVIPLDYPDLVRPGAADHHGQMVRTAARHADCMIYTTQYARDGVNAALAAHHAGHLPSLVRALPVSAMFGRNTVRLPELAGSPYFVVVSTIEPRKNHALLLRVWERLIAKAGMKAPHLVIVGSRGFDADRIMAPLATRPLLRSHVHEVSGLSSPALASLMLGATGILSPTWVEGFGLPVLEANILGVPTIASNIAAHREIACGDTILLPCDDDDAWERAIAATPPAASDRRVAIPHAATESAYCDDLLQFLQALPPKAGS
jgi:glycosyltransferase involved in cell wall biosynthesis